MLGDSDCFEESRIRIIWIIGVLVTTNLFNSFYMFYWESSQKNTEERISRSFTLKKATLLKICAMIMLFIILDMNFGKLTNLIR